MKKIIAAALATAALVGVGVARADAECQRTGTCGAVSNSPRGGPDNPSGPYDPGLYWGRNWNNGNFYGVPPVIADGRLGYPYGYSNAYPRTNRDRDGDGVRNNRDRYPDDPRYR